MKKMILAVAMAASATGPLAAAEPTTCASYTTAILSGWTNCVGFYAGNLFSSSIPQGHIATQQNAVAALGGSFNGDFSSLHGFPSISDGEGPRTFNLGKTFYGETIIGAHFGNIGAPGDQYGNVSVFYKFNFGAAGANSLQFVQSRGLSNLYVYNGGAVPEPATWAMLILGFGAVGGAMRLARKRRDALAFG